MQVRRAKSVLRNVHAVSVTSAQTSHIADHGHVLAHLLATGHVYCLAGHVAGLRAG